MGKACCLMCRIYLRFPFLICRGGICVMNFVVEGCFDIEIWSFVLVYRVFLIILVVSR